MTRLLIRVGVIVAMALTTVTAQQRTGPAPDQLRPPALADHRSRGQSLLGCRRRRRRSRTPITSGRPPAASGRRSTAAPTGRRSSTPSRCSRLARWPWPHRTRTWSGPAPARPTSAATSRSDRASTAPPMPARPGSCSGSSRPAASRASSSTPRTRTARSSARSATPTGRSRSAACSAPPTAARRGRRRCSWTRTPAARTSRWIRRTRASLFAGMWQIEIHTWGRESGGPGSGLYKSTDGGETWTRLQGHGLPTRPHGKVALGIAPSNTNRVYAMIETGDGVPWKGQPTDRGQLWRSDNGGDSWQVVSYDHNVMGRAHYYSRMMVAPDNENEAYFLTASYSKTHRRRQDDRRAAARRGPGRRPPRHLDRSDQREPPDRRPRPGAVDHHQPRPDAGTASA